MKRTNLVSSVALLALSLSCGVAGADDDGGVMEKLATLQGDWIMLDEDGEETDMIASTFRLTAGGSALVEVMAPGSPDGYEMVNMYHADGDRVLMTHYCAAGNQPRMEVKVTDDEDRLEFRFESITNLSSPGANHMHHAEYIFRGKDRITTRWWSMSEGKINEDQMVTIEMKRKT